MLRQRLSLACSKVIRQVGIFVKSSLADFNASNVKNFVKTNNRQISQTKSYFFADIFTNIEYQAKTNSEKIFFIILPYFYEAPKKCTQENIFLLFAQSFDDVLAMCDLIELQMYKGIRRQYILVDILYLSSKKNDAFQMHLAIDDLLNKISFTSQVTTVQLVDSKPFSHFLR